MVLDDRRRGRRRRGAAMVETSIVLVLFFLLVLGLIEVAQLGLTGQLLTIAANAGCRAAVINGNSQSDVTNAVSSVMSAGGISSSAYTLTTVPTDVTTSHLGDPISVTIRLPFGSISWLGSPMLLDPSPTVSSSSTMNSERP